GVAGDVRRLAHDQEEGLRGVAARTVVRGDGDAVRADRAEGRAAGESGGAVAVVRERHPARQGAARRQARRRVAVGGGRERGRGAGGEGGAGRAGDLRRVADGQGEALGGVGGGPVVRRDADVVAPARAGQRCAGEGGGAVAVVPERDAGRQ